MATPARSRFDELPCVGDLGLRHAWDVYGRDDELGSINQLTPERVRRAAALVQNGDVHNVTLPLTEPDPPLFEREPLRHTVYRAARNLMDDRVDSLFPQGSTQWDSLRHVQCREYGFYGGRIEEPTAGPGPLGMEHWVEHGIVGRGVLLDLGSHLSADGPFDPLSDRPVSVDEVRGCAAAQGITLTEGDILCLRFGWTTAYRALTAAAKASYSGHPPFAGLHAGEDTARFLWDTGFAAIACDNPAVENAPGDPTAGSLHRRLIPLLGFALGELFDFDRLAAACRVDGRWDFLFVAAPLNLPGAVGSPGNAVAIR
jgi:kynurenine formamidase